MDYFWSTITAPFKKATEKTKKTIGDFFAPVPNEVRVRDVVREVPGATEKVGKAIFNFGKDILRAAPRAAASATLSAEGEKEFVPGTGVAPRFEKFLFGDKPIKDIRGTGEETIQTFGGSEKTAKKYGLPLGFAMTAMDIVPGIPKKKVAEEVGEQLVKRYGDDVAKMIMEKGGKDLAEKALKNGGEKLIEKAGIKIADAVKPASKVNIGFRGNPGTGIGFGATEGKGIYIAKDKSLAEFFAGKSGKVEEIKYLEPKKSLVVDEEVLPLLQESDILDEPIKKSDSEWIRLNKMAAKQAEKLDGVTKQNWDSDKVAERLTELLKSNGYDAVKVKSGGEAWDVLLDPKLVDDAEKTAKTIEKTINPVTSKGEIKLNEAEIMNSEKAQAAKPRNMTSNAEKALEAINEKGSPVIKEGKKISPLKSRADEIDPPPTPPRVSNENPLAEAADIPRGSALEAIDSMTGKVSQPKSLVEWIKNAPKKFTEAFSDRFAPIKRFEEMISDMAGHPIDINSSAYIGARMYAGRMGTVESYLGDLQKILSPLSKERADFTRFVLSRRALERADRGFENPAGVKAETARQAMEELKTKVGPEIFSKFEAAEQAIQKWADENILKPATESGILSQEVYDSVIEKNRHWMPFHVIDELPNQAALDRMPKGTEIFSVSKQGIIHELEGTEKIIRDPFESIIDKLSNAVNLIKRNEVAQKLINIREVMPEAKDFIKPLEKSERAPKGWGSISVFENGKNTKWIVPEELSWAMHQMNEVEAGILGNFVKFTSAAFRKGATTLYIPFSLSNAVRDAQMTMMTSKYGFNAADWVRGFADGLKGAFGWDSKLIDEFAKNGGGFGGFIQGAREISGVKKQLFEPTWWKRTKAVINPFNLIENFAEAIELAPRLGVYKRALKKGASGLEAAYEARNSTIDFAKAGQEMRIINMWVPFVNARWQALLNTARVFKESPVKSSAKAAALIVTPGITTYFWNSLNYPDLYEDVPGWIKDTYFPIIVGEDKDEEGNRIPKMVLIPKGDVGQIFYNLLEYTLEYVRKGEPSNFAKLALEWMSQLAPIPFTREGELSTSQFLSGALPPILRTPAELATNKSFFTGRQIVPRRLEQVAPTEQYDEKTPYAAVVVGRALGVSPMKLAYGIGGLLGGFGREAIDPAKILESTAERFYRSEGGEKRNQAWNMRDEAVVGYNTAREQAKRALEANDTQTAMNIIDNWNAQADKLLPDILPYLAEDDPQEAQKLRSSVTFQMQDISRLQKSIYNKLSEDEKKNTKGANNPPATMGQMFPSREIQGSDLQQMRQTAR